MCQIPFNLRSDENKHTTILGSTPCDPKPVLAGKELTKRNCGDCFFFAFFSFVLFYWVFFKGVTHSGVEEDGVGGEGGDVLSRNLNSHL